MRVIDGYLEEGGEDVKLCVEDEVLNILKGFSEYYGVNVKTFMLTDEIATKGYRIVGGY